MSLLFAKICKTSPQLCPHMLLYLNLSHMIFAQINHLWIFFPPFFIMILSILLRHRQKSITLIKLIPRLRQIFNNQTYFNLKHCLRLLTLLQTFIVSNIALPQKNPSMMRRYQLFMTIITSLHLINSMLLKRPNQLMIRFHSTKQSFIQTCEKQFLRNLTLLLPISLRNSLNFLEVKSHSLHVGSTKENRSLITHKFV